MKDLKLKIVASIEIFGCGVALFLLGAKDYPNAINCVLLMIAMLGIWYSAETIYDTFISKSLWSRYILTAYTFLIALAFRICVGIGIYFVEKYGLINSTGKYITYVIYTCITLNLSTFLALITKLKT